LKDDALRMPSYELTKMLYSSLENTANSIVPRRHVRSCIDFKCLPAALANACRTVEGRPTAAWLKANRTTCHLQGGHQSPNAFKGRKSQIALSCSEE
jgi:hypothetical protein